MPAAPNRPRAAFALHLAAWLAADLATKQWALGALRHHPPLEVIPGWFRLAYAENTGVAFSMLANQPVLLMVLQLGLLSWMAWAARGLDWSRGVVNTGCGMVLAGALGNLCDRVTRGSVIDFLDVYVVWRGEPRHWPTFNVADTAICTGLALLVLFGGLRPPARTGPGPDPAAA